MTGQHRNRSSLTINILLKYEGERPKQLSLKDRDPRRVCCGDKPTQPSESETRTTLLPFHLPQKAGQAFKQILIEVRVAWILRGDPKNSNQSLQYSVVGGGGQRLPRRKDNPHDTLTGERWRVLVSNRPKRMITSQLHSHFIMKSFSASFSGLLADSNLVNTVSIRSPEND